tara:strand:+ start:401 stop:721 length:321 start_codon:yes stop_codon:yes gene_type:complete
MNLNKMVNNLCTPAFFYFAISMILFVMLLVQNFLNGNVNELCAGSFTCNVSNVIVVFVIKALYISFWTFVLHALCDYGYKRLSWFLVLFPFILCAVLLGMLFLKEM